ncbi:MAG TPA: FkbM family methyltransferase [Bryobacteraceae bacterium]|nr:FkbM family methyltransferase [Bryobacteraceae bacterium]
MRQTRFKLVSSLAILAIAAVALACYVSPALRLKAFFRFENLWTNHWPIQSQIGLPYALEPTFIRHGILQPARIQVEPGISFFLDPHDLIPLEILRTGRWQPEIWSAIAPSLPEGGVFFDVGAHIGYFSMKASRKVGAGGRVLSFEPNPETLRLLRDNISANHAGNITVEPIACTDQEETLTFYAANVVNTGASSLSSENATVAPGAPKPYNVRGRPIDDVVGELGLSRVDAIKVDVEGAEVSVIRGAMRTLERFHPKVVIEVSPRQLASFHTAPEDLAALFKSAGYNRGRPLTAEEGDWEWTLAKPGDLANFISVDNPAVATQFVRGIHDGQGPARWTDSRFTLTLGVPPGASKTGAGLAVKLYVARQSIQAFKEITLSASIGDVTLPPETFRQDRVFQFQRDVPASALQQSVVDVSFSVDKFLEMGGLRYGVLIMSAGLAPQ